MAYTVKQLASISGISPRTLRFYDEIGLLKPAYFGDNQYRYYEEEQLLLLQQILFFRELGVPLRDIQTCMTSPGFDKVETLRSHQITLKKKLAKTERLLKTIDNTIEHLRGEKTMSATHLYEGFQTKIDDAVTDFAKDYKNILLEKGVSQQDIDIMTKAEEAAKTMDFGEFGKYLSQGSDIVKEIAAALEKGLTPTSEETQALISRHYAWSCHLSGKISPNGYYQGFILTADSPKAVEQFDKLHPDLSTYLLAAMEAFTKRNVN